MTLIDRQAIDRMVPVSITMNDPDPDFKVAVYFEIKICQNRCKIET